MSINPQDFRNNRNADTAYVQYTDMPVTAPFFTENSTPSDAEIDSIVLKGGYGIVPAGTLVALTDQGVFVPYKDASEGDTLSTSPILADVPTGTTLTVSIAESYKYLVGDTLMIEDTASSAHNCGAIVSVVVGASSATITFTTATTSAYTVANSGKVYQKATMNTPRYIYQGVYTGEMEGAKNINTTVVISKATFYKAPCWNTDDDAKTVFGNFLRQKNTNTFYLV